MFKINLKCEICGRESGNWEDFVFRWECDWNKKELRNFGVRCRSGECFSHSSKKGVVESWHQAPYFLALGNLLGFFVYLLASLDAWFKLGGKRALLGFLASCLSEMSGKKGVCGSVDANT